MTATFEREDGLHAELNRLVGGKVFEKRVKELTGTHLSPFRLEKITVELTEEEKAEYETNQKIFSDYLAKINLIIRSPADFQKLVMRSGRDPGARRALLARNKARDIAYNSISKIGKLSEILKKHNDEQDIHLHRAQQAGPPNLKAIPDTVHNLPNHEQREKRDPGQVQIRRLQSSCHLQGPGRGHRCSGCRCGHHSERNRKREGIYPEAGQDSSEERGQGSSAVRDRIRRDERGQHGKEKKKTIEAIG